MNTQTLYAVQWYNPDTQAWQACQVFNGNNKEIPTLFFTEKAALDESADWGSDEDGSNHVSNYRVQAVNIVETI